MRPVVVPFFLISTLSLSRFSFRETMHTALVYICPYLRL